MTKNTISITLEGALNALAKNKESNHVAVAGRSGIENNKLVDSEVL